MAQNIKQQPDDEKVVSIHRGRAGRPKGSKNKPKGAAAPPSDDTRAPAFGTNMPDEGIFLRWVQQLRRQDEEVEKVKLELKRQRGIRKDLRTTARGDGIIMRELDEALGALLTENVDLIAREERRRLYFQWLGLPVGGQGQLDLKEASSDDEAEAARWARRGDQDGRLGKPRALPEGCPPERAQVYLQNHDRGYEALMRDSPLTKEGFKDGGAEKKPAAPKTKAAKAAAAASASEPPAVAEEKVLVLREGDFQAGTWLEDTNLKTLMPERREAFDQADRVVALFDTRRRVIKEPGYVDDGEREADAGAAADEPAPPSAEDLA